MKKIFNNEPLSEARDILLLVLRVVISVFIIYSHGWKTVLMLINGEYIKFDDLLGIGALATVVLVAFSEVVCSILLIVGIFSRLAIIPLMISMLIAAFVAHAGQPFQKKELALTYFLIYLTLFVFGSGKFSLEMYFCAPKEKPKN